MVIPEPKAKRMERLKHRWYKINVDLQFDTEHAKVYKLEFKRLRIYRRLYRHRKNRRHQEDTIGVFSDTDYDNRL